MGGVCFQYCLTLSALNLLRFLTLHLVKKKKRKKFQIPAKSDFVCLEADKKGLVLCICVREQEGPTSFFVFAGAPQQIPLTSSPAVLLSLIGSGHLLLLCFMKWVKGSLYRFLSSCNYFSRAEIVPACWEFQDQTTLGDLLEGGKDTSQGARERGEA